MAESSDSLSLDFLCIGVDSNFLAYLFTSAESFNLSLDNCRTEEEGRRKIATFSYDAYLMDLEELKSTATDMAQEIRQKAGNKPIIAIIAKGMDEAGLMDLKEKGLINHILLKPIYPQQIEEVLSDVTRKLNPEEEAPEVYQLQELKKKYDKTIYDKIEMLEMLVKALQKNPDQSELKDLREAVHKMGGSAGSYGYAQVSRICKEMDGVLRTKVEEIAFLDAHWLSSLDVFVEKVSNSFKTASFKGSELIISRTFIKQPMIYVVDTDKEFLELIMHVKAQFLIDVVVESDPETALEKLKEIGFNPNAIIVARTFAGSSITGYDFIETVGRKEKMQPILFGLILEKLSLDDRMEAIERGVDYVFHKPIAAHAFLKSIKGALSVETLGNVKVLVLDDDPDFCEFISAVLSGVGIVVKTIHTVDELFKSLDAFNPQILLLDVLLPKYDGLKLLEALRKDTTYNHLEVVVVTSSQESDTKFKAYAAKADDILYKPLDPILLKERILSLAEKSVLNEEPTNAQGQMGLANLGMLIAALHRALMVSERSELYLVLIELSGIGSLIVQRGSGSATDLLISISNQLELEMDVSTECFALNSSRFAIIFQQNNLKAIEEKTHHFLTNLSKKQGLEGVTFNSCILPITKEIGDAQKVLQKAELGLVEASRQGDDLINIVTVLSDRGARHKREVVLVDPDLELVKMLKTAFQGHGVSVKTYTEGGEVIKYLFEKKEKQLPALIISERKLPDMDGFDLFKKIKAETNGSLPFYFLTVFSSDKDVSEGLKLGVAEYICKPFNISLLMQKALKVIQST